MAISQLKLMQTEQADADILKNRRQLIDQCPNSREPLIALLTRINEAKERYVERQDFQAAANLRDFEREIQSKVRNLQVGQ